MIPRITAVLLMVVCFSAPAFAQSGIYYGTTSNNQIRLLDPTTGATTLVATGGLDSQFAYDLFIVNSATNTAYQLGVLNGSHTLESVNLISGAATYVPFTLSGTAIFGGFYNNNLIVSTGNQVYSVNTATGGSTLISTGDLSTIFLYNKFIVDSANGMAYQYGTKNGDNTFVSFNLVTGVATDFTTNLSGDPIFGGFYNGSLIVAQGNQIRALDVTTGNSEAIANGILTTQSTYDKFIVDSTLGLAYQYGTLSSVNTIETINLVTGVATTAASSAPITPNFGGTGTVVPEPSSIALIVAAGVAFSIYRRSRKA
ncbi:MAG: PEP-CTERM sorting domain-containing protein [Chthoniobacterales bacterium]